MKALREPENWASEETADLVDPVLEEMQGAVEMLNDQFLRLEENPADRACLDDLFRAAHNLKGLSQVLQIGKLKLLSTAMEDLLEELRQGIREPSSSLIDLLLECTDLIQGPILKAIEGRQPIAEDLSDLLDRLRGARRAPSAPPKRPPAPETPPAPPQAQPTAPTGPPSSAASPASLKVRLDRVNQILNLVGEIVIRRTTLDQRTHHLKQLLEELGKISKGLQRSARHSSTEDLEGISDEVRRILQAFETVYEQILDSEENLEKIVQGLQGRVIQMRMVPVSDLFGAHPRMVRDLGRKLGKEAALHLEGQETELDKIVCDHLAEPLMHLVRNALDHGLELPDERHKAGKPPQGRIVLRARHEEGQVVIEVEDDGRGIDPERIRRHAVEKGWFTTEKAAGLSREEIVALLFRPGFSTATAVTDLSGRGVGLDVVAHRLAEIKGNVTLHSEPGRGTRFHIRVPLTLAIIQVLLVRHRHETFAFPITSIREVLQAIPQRIEKLGTRDAIPYRNEMLPLAHLDRVLGMHSIDWTEAGQHAILVVSHNQRRIGVVIDRILKRQTVVIKSLGEFLKKVPYALGCTILGDGQVVLILDPTEIARQELSGGWKGRVPSQETEGEEKTPGSVAAAAQTHSVLLVEDSAIMRRQMARALQQAGYRVAEAVDGAEALRLASQERFDLVSTDIEMPRMDGYELTRRLRALEGYGDTPIVMVTSKDQPLDKVRGFDSGVDDYLTKPINQETYLQWIHRNLLRI
jgi:chemotaxis protein histidine kinase CheA